MPDEAGEFDDDADLTDGFSAPLPPDDRIWRHPSELNRQPGDGGTGTPGRPPRRPVATTYERALFPGSAARAGGWSAGLAGALLATGLVLIGSHLAASMRHTAVGNRGTGGYLTASTTALIAAGFQTKFGADETAPIPQDPKGLGRRLAKAADLAYAATVIVDATDGSKVTQFAGLVVGSDCLVVAPASLVSQADTIDLNLPGGRLVAAKVVGVDEEAGIAVLRCDVQHMTTVPDTSEDATAQEMVALVYDLPRSVGINVGDVVASDQRILLAGKSPLLDAMVTDIPATSDGAAVVDGDGDVLGVVIGSLDGTAVATPTWLAISVAQQLAGSADPAHAWLGIDGASLLSNGQPAGVEVQAVAPASAAQRAGLEPGDVIKGVDGMKTSSLVALQARLYCLKPGTAAQIDVQRGSRSLVEKAMLDHAPAA